MLLVLPMNCCSWVAVSLSIIPSYATREVQWLCQGAVSPSAILKVLMRKKVAPCFTSAAFLRVQIQFPPNCSCKYVQKMWNSDCFCSIKNVRHISLSSLCAKVEVSAYTYCTFFWIICLMCTLTSTNMEGAGCVSLLSGACWNVVAFLIGSCNVIQL